jgi:hypothetical protein
MAIAGLLLRSLRGEWTMEWTSPTYAEIKMDAEIGSYQEDGEPGREAPLTRGEGAEAHDAA